MKALSMLAGLAGLALAAWLLHSYGFGQVLHLLQDAGYVGIGAVIAFHFVQLVFSAAAWRTVMGPVDGRPSLGRFCVLRWLREGVNNLLPVAQIGGEFVAARLLTRQGVPLAPAIAGTIADLTLEMVTQAGFTLIGLAVLLSTVGDAGIAGPVAWVLATLALVALGFVGAQWLGLAAALEHGLLRLGAAMGWSGTAQVKGLHEALLACYRNPRRLLLAMTSHMVSWLLGGLEVCLALHILGHDVGIGPGLVIESLGQALKGAGFAVPGALGVQEGGLVVVCKLFGLSPELAIALSLLKRLREVVLGVPGLLVWQFMETRGAGRGRQPVPDPAE